jgi:hypothetical protein
VSTLEDRLRVAFRADADTVRPDSVPAFTALPIRPVARRARLLTPVAAAIAIAAIAAAAAGTSALLHGSAQRPGRGSSRVHNPAPGTAIAAPLPLPVLGENGQHAPRAVSTSGLARGVPRFFVTDEPADGPDADMLVVRDSHTGKIVGTVAPPHRKYFASVAATGDDRAFVAAVMPNSTRTCGAQLYQFTLNANGQPGPLVALHVAVPGNFNETDTLAVTPDGRTIAYTTFLCGLGTREYGVIDLATRHVSVWSASGFTFPVGLSLSADGRLLAFAVLGEPARILRTTAAGGSILARSQILSSDSNWVALAGNGSAFYGCMISPSPSPSAQKGSLTYFWQAVGSSQPHIIASWHNLSTPQCMANLDPSGHYLLVQFPQANDYVQPTILNVHSGRTTSIPSPAYYGPLTVAW